MPTLLIFFTIHSTLLRMKPILLFIFIGLQSIILTAQTLPETQYREHPHWIAMMENPSSTITILSPLSLFSYPPKVA